MVNGDVGWGGVLGQGWMGMWGGGMVEEDGDGRVTKRLRQNQVEPLCGYYPYSRGGDNSLLLRSSPLSYWW